MEYKDAVERAVHEVMIKLLDDPISEQQAVAELVCDEHPDLCDAYGREYIEDVAERMCYKEIPIQSEAYSELYSAFNKLYFGGLLPPRRVEALYYIKEDRLSGDSVAYTALGTRVLPLRVSKPLPVMVYRLIASMAAISIDYDKVKYDHEMRRLRSMGAPLGRFTRDGSHFTLRHSTETECAKALLEASPGACSAILTFMGNKVELSHDHGRNRS